MEKNTIYVKLSSYIFKIETTTNQQLFRFNDVIEIYSTSSSTSWPAEYHDDDDDDQIITFFSGRSIHLDMYDDNGNVNYVITLYR